MRVAWERLRARRKLGTAIAARSAMIATTIMISTRVKPARFLFSFCNIMMMYYFVCLLLLILAPSRLSPRSFHNHQARAMPTRCHVVALSLWRAPLEGLIPAFTGGKL